MRMWIECLSKLEADCPNILARRFPKPLHVVRPEDEPEHPNYTPKTTSSGGFALLPAEVPFAGPEFKEQGQRTLLNKKKIRKHGVNICSGLGFFP